MFQTKSGLSPQALSIVWRTEVGRLSSRSTGRTLRCVRCPKGLPTLQIYQVKKQIAILHSLVFSTSVFGFSNEVIESLGDHIALPLEVGGLNTFGF